ncbi:MAG: hypothetical protein RLZZ524_1839 [Pseudomonadota bacterium]|jgi:hypothetical protein
MTTPNRRPKDPGEILTIPFRYKKLARSLSSPTVSVTVLAGTDANPQAFLLGTAAVDPADPTQVLQQVQGGVPGVIYGLRCLATTEKGERVAATGSIRVSNLPESA